MVPQEGLRDFPIGAGDSILPIAGILPTGTGATLSAADFAKPQANFLWRGVLPPNENDPESPVNQRNVSDRTAVGRLAANRGVAP